MFKIWLQLDDFLFLARCDTVWLELMLPDLPDSMAETTEDCSSNDYILAVFSNIDADLRPLAPSNPAVSTDPDVTFISPPTSPLTHLPNQISNDEPVSPDSTSTIQASNNDPAVEASSTAGVQLMADDTIEYQHELPTAYSFPTDCSPLLSRTNQFRHRAKTANSVHSHQHHNDFLASKPTAIIRPRINSLLRYGLKPEFNSWEFIFWDNQRKELTNTAKERKEYGFVDPMHHGSPRNCCCPSSFRTLISLDLMFFLYSTESILPFPLSHKINFCSFSVGWVIALRITLKL